MKRAVLLLVGLGAGAAVHAQDGSYLDPSLAPEQRVELLVRQMTLREKVGQMNQYLGLERQRTDKPQVAAQMEAELKEGVVGSTLFTLTAEEGNRIQRMVESSRLKIPVFHAMDSIHGHACYYGTTVFPTAITMASSFDLALVEQAHQVTAMEMRATGYHWAFWPYMSVARDARWGRVGETFGEDPLVVARMAAACVKGLQGENGTGPNQVLACAKAFLGDGQSVNGLNFAPMDLSERTLREVVYPPAKACIDAGCRTIMAAHNEINGTPCHSHKGLLTDLLRGEWGFEGYVVSDWMDIERLNWIHKVTPDQKTSVEAAVNAGVDVHMQGIDFIEPLEELVREGRVSEERIDRAVRAILLDKFRMGLFDENRYVDEEAARAALATPSSRALALEMARKAPVLLKNENQILPLSKALKSVLVAGPLADSNALVGDWVYAQPPENIITVLDGVKALVGNRMEVRHARCGELMEITDEDIARTVDMARNADAIIMVIGDNDSRVNEQWEDDSRRINTSGGENRARSDINLVGRQLEMLQQVHATGKPVVVVLINGRPLSVEWVADHVEGILEAWQPGMMGGQAVAEILFGEVNPSGKLPMTFPRSAGHILNYYSHRPSFYYKNYIFGKTEPLWWFGHGLSYTTFAYSDLSVPKQVAAGQPVPVRVTVKNTGNRAGDEVVLLYVNDVISSVTTPVKLLKDWARIRLEPGQQQVVEFALTPSDLALLDKDFNSVVEPGAFEVMTGALKAEFVLEGNPQ